MRAMTSHSFIVLICVALLTLQQHAGGVAAMDMQDENSRAINTGQSQAAARYSGRQRALQQTHASAGRVVAWGTMTIQGFVPAAAARNVVAAALCGHYIESDFTALALLDDHTVVAWGYGDIWIPANATANVTAIAAGTEVAIALLANGTVVGLSDVIFSGCVPEAAQSNVEAIWAVGFLAAARLKDGALVTWRNVDASVGPSYSNISKPLPPDEQVISIAGVNCDSITIGLEICQWLTLRANGSVVAGDGVSVVPSVVQSGVKAISAPTRRDSLYADNPVFLALLVNGSIVQWSYTSPTHIAAVRFPLSSTGITFASISASPTRSYAVTTGGSLLSWINDNLTDVSSSITANAQAAVSAVIAGDREGDLMSLVLKTGGLLVGFDGSITVPASASMPVSISTGATVTQIAAGRSHALALQSDGHVQVWGDSSNGQLQVPPQLTDVNVIQVAAAGDNSFAVTAQGAVYAWGDSSSNLTKVPLEALSNVIKVATGPGYALALLTNGSVISWGAGPVDPTLNILFPQPVLNISTAARNKVVDIAAGCFTAIAVHEDGSITQWGLNSTAPKLHNVTSVAAGLNHAAAVLSNGTVVFWLARVGNLDVDKLDLGFAHDLKVRKVSLTSWFHPGLGLALPVEGGLVLLENGTAMPVPFACGNRDACLASTAGPADIRSGVSDIAFGAGFALALKTDVATTATDPVPSPSQRPSPAANQSATISLLMTIPATSQLATNSSLQQQFSHQLTAAMASYFQVPISQVTVQLQVLPAAQRRLQQARVLVHASANITATWTAGDQAAPKSLQQQADGLQQQPAAMLPTSMVQAFSIDSAQVVLNKVDTSQLGISGPSFIQPASPSNVPPSDVSSSSTSSSSKKISTGVIAGVTIACVLGLAAVATLTTVCYRRHRRHLFRFDQELHPDIGSATVAHTTGASCGIITPAAAVKIPGLSPGEVFMLATAQNYVWVDSTALPDGPTQPVEAGVNDTQLDMMIQTQQQDGSAAVSQYCPAVQLSMEELRQQVHLLSDGLLGRAAAAAAAGSYVVSVATMVSMHNSAWEYAAGATALVFKCIWPSRFGPNALLAVKVLQNGFESGVAALSSFSYEADLLAATRHPHVVKLYGYCLEPPTVCLILELLPCSLKDVLYKTPTDAAYSQTHSDRHSTTSGGAVPRKQTSSSSLSVPADTRAHAVTVHSSSQPVTMVTSTAEIGQGHLQSTPIIPAMPSKAMLHTAFKSVTLREIVKVCTDIAAGLAYLHNQPAPDATTSNTRRLLSQTSLEGRIVHRDLKPANILLNSQGAAKISDFGLARQHDHTTFATMNLGAGTLPYMAPELLVSSRAGVSGAACTNRVDIYSLGIIMWELLMGQPPWKGMSPTAILAASRTGSLTRLIRTIKQVINRRRLPLPGSVASADREHATMEVPLLHPLPAHSHPDLPKMCQIIQACWHHRELRRPTAAALHGTLAALLQQLEKQEQKTT